MSYAVRLHANAQRDFARAIAWYAAEAPTEVPRFVDDFIATARRLEVFPHLAPLVYRGARRANLTTYPYQLWYRALDQANVIEVIALLHHRQDPAQFGERLS
ncbi:MAG TPA: type II toxin-antitoxin system RelE/ParE family toxin [Candidatus Ruania gallistercoris]|uniref:Type II toxin-antitoxin system RelE/ParE family toxin n=1 Tax=Candidatus Ruania gallistercoris TaxID=2838746 RepID=A0A9D2J2X2_9MICO|nr:type II toxin-antitoxin system RelE/ParE family toxin [Candidatus Ruania gallistercoris]